MREAVGDMSKCKLEKSSTSCKIYNNEPQLTTKDRTSTFTLRNKNDADNYSIAESSSTLQQEVTQSQVLKPSLIIPKSRVLNICAVNPDTKEFEVPTGSIPTSQTGDLPLLSCQEGINKPKYTRPPFLYEQYPLKPALLYDSPLSFVRDPLNRLDQIAYLPQSPLHSITSVLPTCQCTFVNTQYNQSENLSNTQNSRLISGEEECIYNEIANAAWKTREAFASIEETSVESVYSTCSRKGFLVPRSTHYYTEPTNELVEPSITRETEDTTTLSESYKTASQSKADSLVCDNEKHLKKKESFLFYNPCYHYEGENRVGTPLEQGFSTDNCKCS